MPIPTEEERLGALVAGRYRLGTILGRGGTGVVFDATHTWTGRRVAVKLLRPEYARDLGLVRRFLQEAQAAARLEHPNVVSVLDMGSDADGTVYLVLELLEGESLTRRLERARTLAPAEAFQLLVPVMDALVLAHERGIIHRDLKPDNVFLRRDSRGRLTPKLLDFGMAKMVAAAWGHATQSGTLVGTPFYMSPEQAEGKADQGPQTDVWSMGVVLYRCLTGELPFVAETPTALLLAIVGGQAPAVRDRAPDVPAAIARVVDRALVADRAKRWADMRTLLDELRRAAEASGVTFPALPDPATYEPPEPFDRGPAVEPGSRGGRRAPYFGLAIAAVLIAVAVGYALQQTGGGAPADVVGGGASIGEVGRAPAPVHGEEPGDGAEEGAAGAAEAGDDGIEAIEPDEGGAEPIVDPAPRAERRATATAETERSETETAERRERPRTGEQGPEPEAATAMRIPDVAREW